MQLAPHSLNALCQDGPLQWLITCGMVRGSDGRDTKIIPNILQRRAATAWTARYRAGRPARIVGLKPRKRGFSTISTAIHHWLMRMDGAKVGLLGHQDNASTQTLFEMLELFRDTDRNSRNWGNSPGRKTRDNIQYSNGGGIVRLSAESPAKVRSTTLQAISATEWGYWVQSEKALNAALNALAKGVFSSFIGESTPNGVIGSFPDTWTHARWPTLEECPDGRPYWKQWESFLPDTPNTSGIPEDELFIRIFAAWFEFDDSYLRRTPAEQRAMRDSIDVEDRYFGEQDLINRYGLERSDGQLVLGEELLRAYECDPTGRGGHHPTAWEQLAWRRATILTLCNGRRQIFDQEYPSDPHTCFLSSGFPFFDTDSISTLDQYHKASLPPETGNLDWRNRREPHAGVLWRPTRPDDALFHIWEQPIEGCAYLVAIDPATGEANVLDGDPDRHSILVLRKPYRDTQGHIHRVKVVARVRPPCLVPLHTAADWSARLASHYQALVCPEINNTGQAIVVALRQFPGVRLFRRTQTEDPHTGRRTTKELIGHLTDESTRQVMLDRLHKLLRNEAIDTSCPHLIHELRIFSADPNKPKPQAPEGEHDDDVLALAIGVLRLDEASAFIHPTRPRTDVLQEIPSHRRHPARTTAMNT